MNKGNKVKFLDNIFYWIWHFTLKGFPDRAFAAISVIQYAYFIFIIAIVLQLLNDESIIWLYSRRESTLINLPLASVFLFLVYLNMKIYNKKKYISLREKYLSMDKTQVQKHKNTFFIFISTTVLIIILEIKLLISYFEYAASLL